MSEEKKQFTYFDSKNVEHTIEISSADFALVQENIRITDKAMKTKPTTFFKDAMRRFAKNKSSIIGAIVLGIIVLGAVFIPVIDQSPISLNAVELQYQTDLHPKIFDAGFGFWDGTMEKTDQTIVLDWDKYYADGTVVASPINEGDLKNIIGGVNGFYNVKITTGDLASRYGDGGYVRFYCSSKQSEAMLRTPTSHQFPYDFSGDTEYKVQLETVSIQDVNEGSTWVATYGIENTYSLSFVWTDADKNDHFYDLIPLTSERKLFDVSMNTIKAAVVADRAAAGLTGQFSEADDPRLLMTLTRGVEATGDMVPSNRKTVYSNVLIKKFLISTSDTEATIEVPVVGQNGVNETITHQQFLDNLGFDNANKFLMRPTNTITGGATSNPYFWTSVGNSSQTVGYQINVATGSCRWDTYEEKYGINNIADLGVNTLKLWKDKGWIEADLDLIATANLAGK
ncbi:MAG: hypothetical protein J5736_05700, partial [Bacilli bacterium]|nr:hypothetical protein [Bacilli bacterium]